MIDVYEPSLYVGKAPENQRSSPQTGRYTNILESATETGSDFIGAFTFVGVWNNRLMTKREGCLMAGMSAAVCPPSITSIPVHFPRSPPFTPKQWTCLSDAEQPLPTYLPTPSSPYSTINSTQLFSDNSTREPLDTESENDAGLNGGEIFGVILLVVVVISGLVVGVMWRKNRREARLGHAARCPKAAEDMGMDILHKEHAIAHVLSRGTASSSLHAAKPPQQRAAGRLETAKAKLQPPGTTRTGHPGWWGLASSGASSPPPPPYAVAGKTKAPHRHRHVCGPIGSHDNHDLTHDEHFAHHTAEVGKGQRTPKPGGRRIAGAGGFGVQLHAWKGKAKMVGHSHV